VDETKASYAIIKHRFGTSEGSEVVWVIRGKDPAARMVEEYNRKLTALEQHDGWGHYFVRTDMKPGTNPKLATKYWWQEREMRRAKADHPTKRDRKIRNLLRRSHDSSTPD
jgi:hypothetical protein